MRKFLTYLHSTIKLHWMLLAIFIYSAALVAGNLLIIQPQVREYAALKKQRGSLDEIYLKIRTTDVQNVLALLQKDLAASTALATEFKQRCLKAGDLPRLLNELNRAALSSGVKIQSIDPQPARENILPGYTRLPLNLRLISTYPQLLSFLELLEQSDAWLLVEKCEISAQSADPLQHLINLQLFSIQG